MDDRPIIETRDLTRRFGALTALSELTLTVRRGESLAVFGHNGAGKTTLIRIVTLELRPTSGTLRLAGRDPRRADLEIRRLTGVISHRPLLYDELTGRENLAFFARLYAVPDAGRRIEAMLEEVGLTDRADDAFQTYSRGMQQRLALARCLLHDPELVCLDEPFAGLDPHAAQMLRAKLPRLRDGGRTVLLVTHNFREGLELSDRWMLLERGRLADSGPSAGTDPASFEEAWRARLAGAARGRR